MPGAAHGFRIPQPARERRFLTSSGRAEFSAPPLPVDDARGLLLATMRSHDQFNTTIYSNDDRYRGLKGLCVVVFMNADDMRERGLQEFDRVDITSTSRDGTTRAVYGYRVVRFEIPRGCAAVHARAQRALRHRRRQQSERPARHEAPPGRGCGGAVKVTNPDRSELRGE
jgi:anaerobic selenocysteine-containing dehydrogenase